MPKKNQLFLILFSAIVYITREFSFVKIVILLTLNKSKKKMLVILLTLYKSKNVGYFATLNKSKKMLVILLTLNNTDHLWLPTPHCAVSVWLTGRYTMPLVTSYFPPTLLPRVLWIWESIFLLSGVFYLTLLPAFFKASLEPAV